MKEEIGCSVGGKEVSTGWRVEELLKRNRGNDMDFKVSTCALGGPVRKVPMQPGSAVTESSS